MNLASVKKGDTIRVYYYTNKPVKLKVRRVSSKAVFTHCLEFGSCSWRKDNGKILFDGGRMQVFMNKPSINRLDNEAYAEPVTE